MRSPKDKELLVEQLKKTPIVQIACEKIGVSRATYYRWRKEDDSFADASTEAIYIGEQLVNDMAESQLLSAIRDKNMTAIIFWLKHHHSTYETRVKVHGTVKHQVDELTDEQSELVEKALALGGLLTNEGENDEQK